MDTLSEFLISEGIINEASLQAIKKKTSGRSFILDMIDSQNLNEDKLLNIFCEKFRFKKAELSDIPHDVLSKFSKDNILKYMCIPFGFEGKNLKLAMVDPMDFNALQAVSFITGYNSIPYVTSRSELLNAVNTCFETSSDLTKVLDNVLSGNEDNIEVLDVNTIGGPADSDFNMGKIFQTGNRGELANESDLLAPAIKLVNILIKEALKYDASDIHIEPGQKNVTVRFRIDGVLKTQTHIPKWLNSAIVSRIKIMSQLDISNRKTPQDGGVKLKIGDKPVDLRISVLPTHLGEKVVIRILRSAEGVKSLSSQLGNEDFIKLKKHIDKPQGLILLTGPTGSGKTTTLHGILKHIYSEETNIITVEDPVEYEIEGITQVQVNEKAGLTFANTLRSILRQDPNVVMVGEIRDLETAEIALRASMTGHLVLSTLHTTGTAATITRLFDLGVEPSLVASSLLCIVAQRLVRINCEHCLTEYKPDESVLSALPDIRDDIRFMRGTGCDKCSNTGYKGRIAILEIMDISPEIRKFIAGKGSAGELRELTKKEGMRTLYESSLRHVYKGITTVEEVLRVISSDEKTRAERTVNDAVCPNCRRTYMGNECPYCGVLDTNICKGCLQKMEYDWNFCPFCGKAGEKAKLPLKSEKPRVLIVDDEPGILKMVELSLRPLELEVHTAQNGKEALEQADKIKPNLIITDINMPVMDGYALIKELRSNIKTMFLPIIILSSRDTSEDKLKGFTFGTDDYITKPFEYSELQARVKRLIERTYD